MATKTIVTYVCDGCGTESYDKGFQTSNECGTSHIKIKGSRGAKACDGSWGGCSYDINKDLCFECATKVIDFISTLGAKE